MSSVGQNYRYQQRAKAVSFKEDQKSAEYAIGHDTYVPPKNSDDSSMPLDKDPKQESVDYSIGHDTNR
jgi:hypothetical protein